MLDFYDVLLIVAFEFTIMVLITVLAVLLGRTHPVRSAGTRTAVRT